MLPKVQQAITRLAPIRTNLWRARATTLVTEVDVSVGRPVGVAPTMPAGVSSGPCQSEAPSLLARGFLVFGNASAVARLRSDES